MMRSSILARKEPQETLEQSLARLHAGPQPVAAPAPPAKERSAIGTGDQESTTSGLRDLALGSVALLTALGVLLVGIWVGEQWRTLAEWTAFLFVGAFFWLGIVGVQRVRRGWELWHPTDHALEESLIQADPLAPLAHRTRRLSQVSLGMFGLGAMSMALAAPVRTAIDSDAAFSPMMGIGFFIILFALAPLWMTGVCYVGLRRGRRALARGEPVTMTDDELTIVLDTTHELHAQYAEGYPEAAVFGAKLRPDLVEQAELDLAEGIDQAEARVRAVFASLQLSPLSVDQPAGMVRRRGIAAKARGLWMSKPVLITVELTPTSQYQVKARVRAVAKEQPRREHSYFERVVNALSVADTPSNAEDSATTASPPRDKRQVSAN